MTSNIGSQLILGFKGQDYERMKAEVLDVLRQTFGRSSSTASTRSWCSTADSRAS